MFDGQSAWKITHPLKARKLIVLQDIAKEWFTYKADEIIWQNITRSSLTNNTTFPPFFFFFFLLYFQTIA